MARALQIEYAGARHHIMCRGNQSRKIFEKDKDADLFVRTLGEVCIRISLSGFCRMDKSNPLDGALHHG